MTSDWICKETERLLLELGCDKYNADLLSDILLSYEAQLKFLGWIRIHAPRDPEAAWDQLVALLDDPDEQAAYSQTCQSSLGEPRTGQSGVSRLRSNAVCRQIESLLLGLGYGLDEAILLSELPPTEENLQEFLAWLKKEMPVDPKKAWDRIEEIMDS